MRFKDESSLGMKTQSIIPILNRPREKDWSSWDTCSTLNV